MEDYPWTETPATVVACEPILLSAHANTGKTASLQLPDMPQFAVTFKYQANGQEYSGEYVVNAEKVALGHTFTICYDPKDPQKNSGTEKSLSLHPNWRHQIVAAVIAVLIFVTLYWFHNR
jgi:hypothetical protein